MLISCILASQQRTLPPFLVHIPCLLNLLIIYLQRSHFSLSPVCRSVWVGQVAPPGVCRWPLLRAVTPREVACALDIFHIACSLPAVWFPRRKHPVSMEQLVADIWSTWGTAPGSLSAGCWSMLKSPELESGEWELCSRSATWLSALEEVSLQWNRWDQREVQD